MGRKEDIITIHGIPVDDRSVREVAIVDGFAQKGVPMNRKTVYRLRTNTTSGEKLARKLDMSEVLRGSAGKKDALYGDIATTTLDFRTFNRAGRPNTQQLTSLVGDKMGIDPQDIRRSLRAMRIEVSTSDDEGYFPEMRQQFHDAATLFLGAYMIGRKKFERSPVVCILAQDWNKESIADFYRNLYRLTTTPTISKWIPYEAEFMKSYYENRVSEGSSPSPLDQLTLAKNVQGTPLDQLVAEIQLQTGIPYDGVVHFTHTNALLYGQPTRPNVLNGNGFHSS